MSKKKYIRTSKYVAPEVAEMVLRQSARRMPIIVITSTICVLIWGAVGAWLVSLSCGHQWLSSFVEIAFALNLAMSFPSVKEAALKVKQDLLILRVKRKISLGHEEWACNEACSIMETCSKYWIAVYEGRARRELNFCVVLGKWFAGGSLVILLTDCTSWAIFFLPLLIAPAIAFRVGLSVELSMACSDMVDEIKLMVSKCKKGSSSLAAR